LPPKKWEAFVDSFDIYHHFKKIKFSELLEFPDEKQKYFIAHIKKNILTMDDLNKFFKGFTDARSVFVLEYKIEMEKNIILELLGKEFLKSLIKNADCLFFGRDIPYKVTNNFLNSLDPDFLISLVNNRADLRALGRVHPKEMNYFGTFSFLGDWRDWKHTKSISDGIKEVFHQDTPDIQNNILLCLMRVYKSELLSREKEYNPTLLGIALPIELEWGVPKTAKLAAVNALITAGKNNIRLQQVYNSHKEALDQGLLNEIYNALKIVEENKMSLKREAPKKIL
jgi:hypothetical protein